MPRLVLGIRNSDRTVFLGLKEARMERPIYLDAGTGDAKEFWKLTPTRTIENKQSLRLYVCILAESQTRSRC